MKNFIIDWQIYKTEFEDEEVVVMLKRLNRAAFLSIAPELAKTQIAEKGEDSEQKKVDVFMAGLEIQGAAEDVLQEHVLWKTGFLVNGEMPTIKTLCDYSMFSGLIMDILGELIHISTVSTTDVKN